MNDILKSRRFLVVDDMNTMRMLVKQTLRGLGGETFDLAADGEEAWKMLTDDTRGIDFIVSDWNMPNMTGIELLKKVRSSEKFKDMAFILVTAEQDVAQVQEAIKSGVDGYIVKPFNKKLVESRLRLVLKKKFGYKG